jgi:hypothetical protein
MSKEIAALLEAFESLPEEEKRAFTAEFLRRAAPFDSGPLDDAETARAADELFARLPDTTSLRGSEYEVAVDFAPCE